MNASKLYILFHATILMCVMAQFSPAQNTQEAVDSKPPYSSEQLDEFSKRLGKLQKGRQFNGTVLIAKDGKILFEQGFGYSNIVDEKPIGPRSSFRLASVSKQFTAMAIMMLKEAGKLQYDDDIRKFLPELPYEGITIRHLLHHTGGLPDYMSLFAQHWDKGTPLDHRKTAFNKDAVKLFSEVKPKPVFNPGEKWAYSNTGYVLLGHIIEQASGQPTHKYLQEKIFEPLDMQDSRAFTPTDEFQLEDRVYGFRYKIGDQGQLPNDWHYLNGMIGDGGVYSSARDMLKWDQALYGETLVKKSTLDEAFTSGKLNDGSQTEYGFGWQIGKSSSGGVGQSHGGRWVGFGTFISREPENKMTVILLTSNSIRNMSPVFVGLKKLRNEK